MYEFCLGDPSFKEAAKSVCLVIIAIGYGRIPRVIAPCSNLAASPQFPSPALVQQTLLAVSDPSYSELCHALNPIPEDPPLAKASLWEFPKMHKKDPN